VSNTVQILLLYKILQKLQNLHNFTKSCHIMPNMAKSLFLLFLISFQNCQSDQGIIMEKQVQVHWFHRANWVTFVTECLNLALCLIYNPFGIIVLWGTKICLNQGVPDFFLFIYIVYLISIQNLYFRFYQWGLLTVSYVGIAVLLS